MRSVGLCLLLVACDASAQTSRPVACKTSQLLLTADAKNGAFDGMSHSGTMLVLKNTSKMPCSLMPPVVAHFEDASGANVKIVVATPNPFKGPRSMGHGPVLLPTPLAAGAIVSASLRWVSGEVYDHSVCIEPSKVVVTAGGDMPLQADVRGHICGPSADTVGVTMSAWK